MAPRDRRAMPFGAELADGGRVRFRLWAPDAHRVAVRLEPGAAAGEGGAGETVRELEMQAEPRGWFSLTTGEAGPETRYRYLIDGTSPVPDPASRFQPEGVAGPSEVVDPSRYEWRVPEWRGRPWREAVVYELHIGTFTRGGTYAAAAERLDYLADLGVTAVELMPVASFAGSRGWGYDGVLLYAPHPAYGRPDDLRAFVDACHERGLMVLLDVVYNHFGPEGNYLHLYASGFFTERHHTPWGAAINFDGADARPVRDFYVHNALHWLDEYRLDGLRLDAVHAIVDDSEPHILEELAEAVHEGPGSEREIHLVLENDANEARYLRPVRAGARSAPYAAQWNDDFHHACHTLVTRESDGYYADYADAPLEALSRCLREGFAYQGEPSPHRGGARRGEPSADLPSTAFVNFLQNHDQVGNRAFGERLTVLADEAPLRAVTALALLGPGVPLLFMGEEFGCRRPFLYFADYEGELAAAVRQGRQREFASFEKFGAGGVEVPDPMAEETFRRSTLEWPELDEADHARWLERYRDLLGLRGRHVAPRLPAALEPSPGVFDGTGLALVWRLRDGARLALLANLGAAPLRAAAARVPRGRVLYADPARAAEGIELPPWSVVWRIDAP